MTAGPTYTSWDQLPLMVPLEKVAELYQRSPRAIERLVRIRSRSLPSPVLTHPMVWSRADLEDHWRGKVSGVIPIKKRA